MLGKSSGSSCDSTESVAVNRRCCLYMCGASSSLERTNEFVWANNFPSDGGLLYRTAGGGGGEGADGSNVCS